LDITLMTESTDFTGVAKRHIVVVSYRSHRQ